MTPDSEELLKQFFREYIDDDALSKPSATLLADILKKSGNNSNELSRELNTVRALLINKHNIESYKDKESLHPRIQKILEISHPHLVAVVLDVNTYDNTPIYGEKNKNKSTVTSGVFDSYSSLMESIEDVKKDKLLLKKFTTMLKDTLDSLGPSLLTRLFQGNYKFDEFMKDKWDMVEGYIDGYDAKSSFEKLIDENDDQRIVHLLHVFGGIEGTEAAHEKFHTQSLINCLNETGNGDIAQEFSADCFNTGYGGHYFCLMVTDGNRIIKNLDSLEAGDTITILDRGAPIFEADYCQASYTVAADVEKIKSFFKSCERKENYSVIEEFNKALVDSKALSQQAYQTKSQLGGFDSAKRYGGKYMKKGICTMNQKLFIREALILEHGLEEGLGKYKEFSTIYRMREFDKFYLQSDASLFLEDEIVMVKNIIGRIKKGYIKKESIQSCESISPIMKEFWSNLMDSNYDESKALLMIREIKKTKALSEESSQEYLKRLEEKKFTYDGATPEEQNNIDYLIAQLSCRGWKYGDIRLDSSMKNKLGKKFAQLVKAENKKTSKIWSFKKKKDNVSLLIDKLKSDREFMLAAVTQNPPALQYASKEFTGDRQFILEAVKQNGEVLQYVSEELRCDQELVMEAVKENAQVLVFLERFKDSQDFVLAAVTQNPLALQYAPEEFKK